MNVKLCLLTVVFGFGLIGFQPKAQAMDTKAIAKIGFGLGLAGLYYGVSSVQKCLDWAKARRDHAAFEANNHGNEINPHMVVLQIPVVETAAIILASLVLTGGSARHLLK